MTPEEIYDRYGEKMFHYAALRLGSLEDTEDVLQETFARLSRYAIRWSFIRNPKAFVFKVLRNETNRFLRGKISRPSTVGFDILNEHQSDCPIGENANPAFSLQTAIADSPGETLSVKAATALSSLPDEQREVVILKIFQGMSFKEIAAVCGLSINTAASRYRYALEKLRTELGREG